MTTKPSNVAPGVQAQQTAELRQQVNAQPFKPAVIVGKVELAPRREVVVQKPAQRRPPPTTVPGPGIKRSDRAKQMKRSDDNRAAAAGNQAMLAELQFVKKQNRTFQEAANNTSVALTTLGFETVELLELILSQSTAAGVQTILENEAFTKLTTRFAPLLAKRAEPKAV
jgi:hypothetical protein